MKKEDVAVSIVHWLLVSSYEIGTLGSRNILLWLEISVIPSHHFYNAIGVVASEIYCHDIFPLLLKPKNNNVFQNVLGDFAPLACQTKTNLTWNK